MLDLVWLYWLYWTISTKRNIISIVRNSNLLFLILQKSFFTLKQLVFKLKYILCTFKITIIFGAECIYLVFITRKKIYWSKSQIIKLKLKIAAPLLSRSFVVELWICWQETFSYNPKDRQAQAHERNAQKEFKKTRQLCHEEQETKKRILFS